MSLIQLKYDPAATKSPAILPLSKSIALRVLTLNEVSARLGNGRASIPQLPDAEDVEGMMRAITHYAQADSESAARNTVNIGEGGAPFRFFTALAASTPGLDMTVATSRSLMRRPLAILLDALRLAGADIRCERREGYPPLRIVGRRLNPGVLGLNPSVSSQFISALMMASPLWESGLALDFDTSKAVSLPYLAMTRKIMERFGCEVTITADQIRVAAGRCVAPDEFEIETDWSAASYFYELALLTPGTPIPLQRLTPADESLQGDAMCASIFSLLGVATKRDADGRVWLECDPECLRVFRESDQPLELDLNGQPDLVPALAVGCVLAGVRFIFRGVGHLRHKETNRMLALCTELEKLGYSLTPGEDTLAWEGRRCPAADNESISTYSDHRMAMAFAPAAARLPWITIEHPEVVGKSFPRYWENLERLGFVVMRKS